MLPLVAALALASSTPAIDVTVMARALQPGELVALTVSGADRPTSVRVSVFGQSIPVYQTGSGAWVALIGIDLDRKPGRYVATIDAQLAATTVHLSRPLVILAKRFPTRRLRVDPEFVNPTPDELARIEMESRLIGDLYARPSAERLWSGPFVRPVPDMATSIFGSRSVFNGSPRSPHGGTDFLSPAGRPIHAPNSGRIVAARELYFTGNTVIIDHGLGVFSLLAHLSRVDVHEGDTVAAGDVVGLVGATGRVTGPHLHWALRVSGARVDVLSALAVLGPD